jgi:predicted RNA methylase
MRRTEYNRPKEDVEADANRGFVLPYHYELVSDRERVGRFAAAIRRACPGRVVLEIGCGSGVLSLLAASVAKHVYAVEFDPRVAAIAANNFARSRHAHRIELRQADIKAMTFPSDVEVVICENLSTGLVNEPQVLHMNIVAKSVKPKTVRIPERVVNLCEGVEADFEFDDVEVRVPYYQFSGLPQPRLLTESRVYSAFCFDRELSESVDAVVRMVALSAGRLNALRVTSVVHLCDSISFYSTDSLMPPVVVPLPRDVAVRPGDSLLARIRYRCGTDWRDCQLDVEHTLNCDVTLQKFESRQALRDSGDSRDPCDQAEVALA